MSYELLEQAPNHQSDDFIDYLRENNVVIFEDNRWIMIENCKYHKPEKRHYTAFPKDTKDISVSVGLYSKFCNGWQILVKRESDRSINRWHVHFME